MTELIRAKPFKTTTRQDVKLMTEFISRCDAGDLTTLNFQFTLSGMHEVLFQAPLEFGGSDFDTNVRASDFGKYLRSTLDFVLNSKFCVSERHYLNQAMGRPLELGRLRSTWLGRVFAKAPYALQASLVHIIRVSQFAIAAIKRYRWIFSVVSIVALLHRWAAANEITAIAIAGAIAVGSFAAVVAAFVFGKVQHD